MDFNKWDRIYMTNEQCLDLIELFAENEKNPNSTVNLKVNDIENYSLTRFILTVPNGDEKQKDIRLHHVFALTGSRLDITTFGEMNKEIVEVCSCSVDMERFKLIMEKGPATEQLHKRIIADSMEFWEYLLITFVLINLYILSDPEKTVDIEEREVRKKSKYQSKRSQKNPHKVRLVRTYRLKKKWKTAVKKRIHEITCLAWGVRGHYRHYKDGRVIFIKPYVKGKKRDEYQGKIYELFPRQNCNLLNGKEVEDDGRTDQEESSGYSDHDRGGTAGGYLAAT